MQSIRHLRLVATPHTCTSRPTGVSDSSPRGVQAIPHPPPWAPLPASKCVHLQRWPGKAPGNRILLLPQSLQTWPLVSQSLPGEGSHCLPAPRPPLPARFESIQKALNFWNSSLSSQRCLALICLATGTGGSKPTVQAAPAHPDCGLWPLLSLHHRELQPSASLVAFPGPALALTCRLAVLEQASSSDLC